MNIYVLISAFFIGLVSSIHCVGMCGPIVASLPYYKLGYENILVVFLYHFGRIFTYAFLGLIATQIGITFQFIGFLNILTILVGAILVFSFFNHWIVIKNPMSSIYFKLSQVFHRFFNTQKSKIKYLGLGILNGFLPCGTVYLALTSAIIYPQTHFSILYMIAFGIGTLPLLLSFSYLKNAIIGFSKFKKIRISATLALVVGFLLIIKGFSTIYQNHQQINKNIQTKVEFNNACH